MSEHLRSAEDVAVSFTGECEPEAYGLCANHRSSLGDAKTCLYVLYLSALIRARDEQVREAARAEALADVEPRIAAAVEHLRDYSCCDDVARILGSEA